MMTINSCALATQTVPDKLDEGFQDMFNASHMNEYFQIHVEASGEKKLSYGSKIKIDVSNLTDQEIIFLPNSSTKLFVIRENNWIQIDNYATYYDDLILLPKGSLFGDNRSSLVIPMLLQNMDKKRVEKEIVRIVMVGELLSNEQPTGVYVGAYTDVILTP